MATPATNLLLGPLTTTFIPPSDCTSITVSAVDKISYGPYIWPRLFSFIANSCFPPLYPLGNEAQVTIFGPYNNQDQHDYFSPGICPSAWGQTNVGNTGAETTAICCGPGYGAATAPAGIGGGLSTFCASTLVGTIVTTIAYTRDGEMYGSSSMFTFGETVMPAGGIWIRFKSDDFIIATSTPSSLFTSASLSSSSTSSSSISSSSTSFIRGQSPSPGPGVRTSQASPSSSPTNGPASLPSSISSITSTPSGGPTPVSGLSIGSKIGIGIGSSVAGLFILCLLVFLLLRRYRHQRHQVSEIDGYRSSPSFLPGGPVSPVVLKSLNQRGGGDDSGVESESSAANPVIVREADERRHSELPAEEVNWRQNIGAESEVGGRIVPVSEMEGELPMPYHWGADRRW